MSSEQSYAKRMMNVPGGSTHTQPPDYLAGHRDACHACADIAAQADADLAALREQLAAKDARIAELEAVVGKLPKTADGVPTYPGMPAWFAFRDGVHEAVLMMQSSGLLVEAYFPDGLEIFRDDDDEPYEVDYSRPAYSACYSTREAALAAAEAKP